MLVGHAGGVKRSIDQVYGIERRSSQPSFPIQSSRESPPTSKNSPDLGSPQSRSGQNTPSLNRTSAARTVAFEPEASIVLVGIRGVGKSSLGILAATAYGRKLIEVERVFGDATGTSQQSYRKSYGAAEYRRKRDEVLSRTLQSYGQNAVIVCSFSDLEGHGLGVLVEFAQTHPVIHITRDYSGILEQLNSCDLERIRAIMAASNPILRSCSNFEFFNLSEQLHAKSGQDHNKVSPKSTTGSFLTLKRVERDFLRMLRNVIGDHEREQAHHSAYPLSKFWPHHLQVSMMASITVDEVLDPDADLEELQIGVDAVELRVPPGDIDAGYFFCIGHAFSLLRRVTILPIVTTVDTLQRVQSEKGRSWPSSAQIEVTSFCLRLAPEYCTVELSLDEAALSHLIANKGRTIVIGDRHLDKRPPNGWNDARVTAVYDQARRLTCELCKITMPAKLLQDNFAVQGFRERAKTEATGPLLICYNIGPKGKPSICFNTVMTPTARPGPTSKAFYDVHNGYVTAREIYSSLFASFIYEPMHFFIYGANVGYSLSPAMHNAAYAACGMSHRFVTHAAPDLEDFKKLCAETDFGGCAVVQPFKIEVLPLLAGLSSHAQVIGSVNTVTPIRELNEDGSIPSEFDLISNLNRQGPVKALYGQNTDWIGIRACLRRGLSPANTVRGNSTALVCGAGGQARATVYAMLSLGVRNIFICNRTRSHAQVIADHFNALVESRSISELDTSLAAHTQIHILDSLDSLWPIDKHRYPTMIVSSIPTQRGDGSAIDFRLRKDWLSSPTGGVVCELAYRPMVTPIVQQMKELGHRGWVMMDGFDVLPEQAFAQFELFTGRRAPRKLMREQVIKHYQAEQDQLELRGRNLDPNPAGK